MYIKASIGIPPTRHSCFHRWLALTILRISSHKAHGINNQGSSWGGQRGGRLHLRRLVAKRGLEAIDLGFLGSLNYSEAYGVNDLSHVVGNSAIGSFIHGFLWRSGQMTDLGALSGQVVSQASAINNNSHCG
jgi:probable HAF family extracellular repeat protein